ncbi:DUF5681 domain-containing protein [Methylocystis sp.]|uniref:DUF5681 domain-containing protein n=1 Tax=Methylocystis sp. TaxID=1911079 RepID=UPI0025D91B46|nr:DUF5681 domain-containing protein [Methylocystis sp.]
MTANAEKKQRGRPFVKGQSGNPGGKAKGAKNHATRAVEALLDGEAEALTRTAIDKALEGDGVALRLCLERLCPPRRSRHISFALPAVASAADASSAMGAVIANVADGNLTPEEAASVAGLIESYVKTLEARDLEERIKALEQKVGAHD